MTDLFTTPPDVTLTPITVSPNPVTPTTGNPLGLDTSTSPTGNDALSGIFDIPGTSTALSNQSTVSDLGSFASDLDSLDGSGGGSSTSSGVSSSSSSWWSTLAAWLEDELERGAVLILAAAIAVVGLIALVKGENPTVTVARNARHIRRSIGK
jgi:hypothetical protein